jgi:hypothetical protein
MRKSKWTEYSCPSAMPKKGAKLLGIVIGRSKTQIFPAPLDVDNAFFEQGTPVGPLDERFRFIAPCVERGCNKWSGSQCNLIKRAVTKATGHSPIPKCSMRRECRWFFQHGEEACRICPQIVRRQRFVWSEDPPPDERGSGSGLGSAKTDTNDCSLPGTQLR